MGHNGLLNNQKGTPMVLAWWISLSLYQLCCALNGISVILSKIRLACNIRNSLVPWLIKCKVGIPAIFITCVNASIRGVITNLYPCSSTAPITSLKLGSPPTFYQGEKNHLYEYLKLHRTMSNTWSNLSPPPPFFLSPARVGESEAWGYQLSMHTHTHWGGSQLTTCSNVFSSCSRSGPPRREHQRIYRCWRPFRGQWAHVRRDTA